MQSFDDLIAPMSAAEFFSAHHDRKPVHIPCPEGKRKAMLDWAGLNRILDLHTYWIEPHMKLVMGNRAALTEHYCDEVETLDGNKTLRANPAKVKAFLGMGASMVANRVHDVSPPVRDIAAILEETFGAGVGANIYCSFKGVQAFQSHYDLHDVFAIHTEGEKTWTVYENRADNPVNPLPPGDATSQYLNASKGNVLFKAHMKPGDLLYLPRGWYHDALASSDASMHVTFSVSPNTGLSLFKLLEREAKRDSAFRAFLPHALDDEEALQQRLGELGDRLKALVTSSAFATEVKIAQRKLKNDPTRFDLPHVAKPQFYAVNRGAGRVTKTDQGAMLETQSGHTPLGISYEAVDHLLKQQFFTVEDMLARFPYLERQEFEATLARLEQANLIARTQAEGMGGG